MIRKNALKEVGLCIISQKIRPFRIMTFGRGLSERIELIIHALIPANLHWTAKKFSAWNIPELLVINRVRLEVACRVLKKTFGEVVAKQSMENIWSFFENDKQKLQSTELEYQYHSCSDVLVKQLEIKISGLLQRELKLQQNTSG